jgi:hypothetical protein
MLEDLHRLSMRHGVVFTCYVDDLSCPRRPNFDPPCRSNIDPGMDTDREAVSCG